MSVTFDDFEDGYTSGQNRQKPLWTLGKKLSDDEEVLKWMNEDFEIKKRQAHGRIREYIRNQCYYKGVHYKDSSLRRDFDTAYLDSSRGGKSPKIVFNHVMDMVDTRVSKFTAFRPNVIVDPASKEPKDRFNAHTIKSLIDTRFYDVDIDQLIRRHEQGADIFGENYIMPFWNKDIGGELPAAKKLRERGTTEVKIQSGETVSIDSAPVMLGDIDYRIVTPDRLLPERRRCWADVEHVTEVEFVHADVLKARYPNKADKIKPSGHDYYDLEAYYRDRDEDDVLVMTLWHRSTNELGKGRKIVATADAVLENEDHPYEHKKIPYIRETDIDVEGELHGRSFIGQIRQAQRHSNTLASGVARNHGLASVPKWVYPKGSIETKRLANDATTLAYKGPIAPQLVNYNPTAPEVFTYMDRLERTIEKLSKINPISRGETPEGVTSGAAFEELEQQEKERSVSRFAKKTSVLMELTKQTISLMGQYYKVGEGRIMKVLGPNNEFTAKQFEGADFNASFDVKVQKSSFLPERPAARARQIKALNDSFPGLFTNEEVVGFLDLAEEEKYKDQATVNVQAAEAENQMMIQGEQAEPPQKLEDQILHWRSHLREMQNVNFRFQSEETKESFKNHMMGHEYLMFEMAKFNPIFRQKLVQLEQFPVFLDVGDTEGLFEIQAPPKQGNAKAGALPEEEIVADNLEQGV